MGKITELKHALAEHHLTLLRDASTPPSLFREQIRRLTLLLAYEATASLTLESTLVKTPMAQTDGKRLNCRIGLIPILRAGLGMSAAVMDLIPEAEVWHLGFYRDESSLQPVEYYRKFSEHPPDHALILDPMLATGGSACESISTVKRWGVTSLSLLCIIAAPEGIEQISATHPDVDVFTCKIDERLNRQGYIMPGLGDAGDRIFNTQ